MSDTRPPFTTDPDPAPQPGTDPVGSTATPHSSAVPTREVAAEEAKTVADDARSGAQQVAAVAKDEAAGTVEEARYQFREVLSQARGELSGHASAQQARAASGLSAVADELRSMAQHGQDGPMTGLARQAAERAQQLVSRLEGGQPEELLDDLRAFARRRPGAFLAGAAVAGFLGGRLTRGLAAESSTGPAPRHRVGPVQGAAPTRPVTPAVTAPEGARSPYAVDPIQGEGPIS